MKRIFAVSVLAAGACLAVVCTAKAESTYIWNSLDTSGKWSDVGETTHWQDAQKPPADGTATPVFANDFTSSTTVTVDEDAFVYGLSIPQVTPKSVRYQFAGSSTLKIGAGGIFGIYDAGSYAPSDANHGRMPDFMGPIELTASQEWCFYYSGAINGDWITSVSGGVSAGKDVDLLLSGSKYAFTGSSPAEFLGRTRVADFVYLNGGQNFNRLGREIIICDTNCSAHLADADVRAPAIMFSHSGSGTQTVNSSFSFDCANSTTIAPCISVVVPDATWETKTVFAGSWRGTFRGYGGLTFAANGKRDSVYVADSAYGGAFRPETSQWVFAGDNSDLTVVGKNITDGHAYIQLNALWVVAGDNAFGNENKGFTFYVQPGLPHRLQGVLLTDGRSYTSYVQHSAVSCPSGAITLYGISEPGTCSFGQINSEGANNTNGGEMPIWFYNVPGGTTRLTKNLTINGTGHRHLPVNVWGGGTTVLAGSEGNFKKENFPLWVRDGRLVATTQKSVGTADVQVGVNHPKTFKVRAMTMKAVSGVVSYATPVLTFTAGKMPQVDGVTLQTGDKVMVDVPNGKVGQRNGIYTVDVENNRWTRIDELDESAECLPDIRVDVEEGTRWAGTRWFLANEPYRIGQRLGTTVTQTFEDYSYCLAFLEDKHPNPDVSFMIEGENAIANDIVVVDNQSTGKSELGGTTADASEFTGTITVGKDLTVSAIADGICTISGAMTGSAALIKEGAGEVVIAAQEGFTATNLVLRAGKLTLPSSILKSDLSTAEFAFTDGATAELNLSGDVDLDGWTFTVTGLAKPEDRDNPPTFAFKVTSADGAVTGTPTVVLTGTDPRNWSAVEEDGVWQVRYTKPGVLLLVR